MTERTLEEVIENLRRQFGQEVLMRIGDEIQPVPVISTGSLKVDRALGVGGIPRSRITELFGPEGAGKTTLAQHIVAEAQRLGDTAVYIDMEHKVDPEYMRACGIDLEELVLSQPPNGTVALDLVRQLAASNQVGLIVVDSVAALSTSAELDAAAGDHFIGIQARLMSQNLKSITPILGLSKAALLFINQTRFKIGVMYGNPETTPGGVALKFYTSVRMRIQRIGRLGPKENPTGIRSRVKIVKNCLAPPWRSAEIEIDFGKGISREGELLDLGTELGILVKSGNWYNYGEQRLGNGKEQSKAFLREHPDIAESLAGMLSADIATA